MGHLLQCPLIGTTCDKNGLHLANDKNGRNRGFLGDQDMNDMKQEKVFNFIKNLFAGLTSVNKTCGLSKVNNTKNYNLHS